MLSQRQINRNARAEADFILNCLSGAGIIDSMTSTSWESATWSSQGSVQQLSLASPGSSSQSSMLS